MKVWYIWFTADMVSAGEYEAEDKATASRDIHNIIRDKTSEKYGCLISDKIDFIGEVEKCTDVDEYIKELIVKISLRGDNENG